MSLRRSDSFRKDMEILKRRQKSPFIKDGRVDADAYIEFATEFNEFINHEPKPFKAIIDRDMRL